MNRRAGLAELQQAACRRMLTLAQCAECTGMKVSTWRAWVLLRKVPYHKIGRSVRISEDDLNRLISESRVAAREERDGQ
jgi:excisionase family DNA binding protein